MSKMLFVMDPIESININKDTTFVIMLECQARGHEIRYCELEDLFVKDSRAWADSTALRLERKKRLLHQGFPRKLPHLTTSTLYG